MGGSVGAEVDACTSDCDDSHHHHLR